MKILRTEPNKRVSSLPKIYDFKTKKLQIAAANNPVWIVRTTSSNIGVNELELIEIKPDKMPVGKHDRDNVSFTQQQIQLRQI